MKYVCKHNPKTGRHLCGSSVPRWAKQNENWTHGGSNPIGPGGRNRADNFLVPGETGLWCCENDPTLVTCPKCLALMAEKEKAPVDTRRAVVVQFGHKIFTRPVEQEEDFV